MKSRKIPIVTLACALLVVPKEGEAAPPPTCLRIQQGTSGNVRDSFIASNKVNQNYGALISLLAGQTADEGMRHALIRFDLSAIPPVATISSASATLFRIGNGGAATMRGHRIAAAWVEGSVTWNSFSGAFSPAIEFSFSNGGAGYTGPLTVDLKPLVQAWVSGAYANNGLLIEQETVGTNTNFASSNFAQASSRPKLNVCYTIPPAATCGDGVLAGTEGCDDGNVVSGDGCSAACAPENGFSCIGSPSTCTTTCGDGIAAGAEGCDDGDAASGDGCSAACQPENGFVCNGSPSICSSVCGDGLTVGAEGCDDGNAASGDGCSAACIPEGGFSCSGSPSACVTACGDGITAGAEGCDDGNGTMGDGCSAACQPESGFACSGSPSICASVCGDGIVAGAEGCDDGNGASGDGCSSSCSIQSGFSCSGAPSVCVGVCGDGIVVSSEGCDDGNTAAGDGCGPACTVENAFSCSGSPSVCTCAGGTPCNDGNACTQADVCTGGGACTGTPIVCTPAECESAGACNPLTGCVFSPAADGTLCAGGACQNGQCLITNLLVSVYSPTGDPIAGAKVQIVGSPQKTTDANGQVTFSAITAGTHVARITSTGFAAASPSTDVQAGASNSIVAHLLPEGEPIPFQVSSGVDTIVDNKVRVMIPNAGLVNTAGNPVTGVVEMTVAPLDPSTDLDMMPGELVGLTAGSAEPVGLISVFMADISLRQGAKQVQLAPGTLATIEFTLPDDLQSAYQPGDTIDAWYFDLGQGIWIQDGSGTVAPSLAEPGKLVWTKEVSHFTWWNADFWKPLRDCVVVTVLQSDSPSFIGGATVTVSSLSNNYYRYTKITDGATGTACVDMPINDVVRVTASHTTYPNIVGNIPQILTGVSPNGPTCAGGGIGVCKTLTIELGGTTCINGVVEDGLGGFIDGAQVIARYDTGRGPESKTSTTDVNGEYCVSAPVGAQVVVQASSPGGVTTAEKTVDTSPFAGACGDLICTNADLNTPPLAPACAATCATWAFGDGNASLQTARDVAVDAAGDVFIAGYFAGALPALGLVSNGFDDIYVAKFDPGGNLLWAKRFGDAAGTGTQQAYAIAVDKQGNPVIVGSFSNTITFPRPPGLGDFTLSAIQGFDGFVTKLSGLDGTSIEARRIGGNGNQRVVDVMMDNSNACFPDSIVILAQFNDEIDCSGGVGGMCPSHGGDDILVTKIFADSFYVWSQTYGGVGDEHPLHGGVNTTGKIVLTGDFNSAFSFGAPTSTLTPSIAGTDAFVAQLQFPTVAPDYTNVVKYPTGCPGVQIQSAAAVWSRSFGSGGVACASPGNRNGRGAAFDGLGNVWVTGDFDGCILLSTLEVAAGAPATDAFVARLNGASGATLSYDIIRNSSQQHGSDIAIDTDGGLLLTGTVRGAITFGALPSKPPIGLEDLFIAKLNTSGNYVWATRFGGTPTSVAVNSAIAVRPFAPGPLSGDIAVTGTFNGKIVFDAGNGVEVVSAGGGDVFVAKLLSSQ